MEHPIAISIHETVRGKPVKVTDTITGESYLSQNGKKINLGYGWITIDAEWDDVFELITVDGCATAAALTSDNRRESNYLSRQVVMVDIDSGMRIEDLQTDSFYQQYAAGYYTTPSHTITDHRFRILFITEQPIVEAETMRKVIRGLMMVYNHADPSCKDAARLFYGTINATRKEKRNNILSNTMIEILIAMVDAYDEENNHIEDDQTVREYPAMTDSKKRRIVELLQKTPLYNYNQWRSVGWALKGEGFDLADFQFITNGMMRQKTAKDAAAVWADGDSAGGDVTMGTVISILKKHHGEDCLKGGHCEVVRKQKEELAEIDRKIKEIQNKLKEINK